MFDRVTIKETAKARMSGWMGNAILVVLIVMLLGGAESFVTNRLNLNYDISSHLDLPSKFPAQFLLMFFPLLAVLSLIGVAYNFCVANIIYVGQRGWFLRYRRGEYPSVGELFASFRIYFPCFTTKLLQEVYVFLWSLLLIIPGIVMGYAYSMADYIIYENPNISASKALAMSRQMTMGYKGDLFIFDLSYIGWELVSLLTCGILAIVYVYPYKYTAHAGIYETLKQDAIRRGILHYEDFGMVPPPPPAAPGGSPYGTQY